MKLYKGNFVWAKDAARLQSLEGGYVAVDAAGVIKGVYPELPEKYANLPVDDLGPGLVIPGFVDLHMHSAQLAIQGLGYDESSSARLDNWLHPIEHRYNDPAYAAAVNQKTVNALVQNGTMRSVLMSSTGLLSALDLFEQLEQSGLYAYVGKMNSDYSAYKQPNETTEATKSETQQLLEQTMGRSERVKPILSPEFLPCCSAEALEFLGQLKQQYKLPLATHMSGSAATDIAEILSRFPAAESYLDVYDDFGLLGPDTILIHCNRTTPYERMRMAELGVTLAHCPTPLLTMGSALLFSVGELATAGNRTGLGSDMGGGYTLYMPEVIVAAISLSKWSGGGAPLGFAAAYYLATRGGRFFGNAGAFEPGYGFDALAVNDGPLLGLFDYTAAQRLERFVFCGGAAMIERRFCQGRELYIN